MKLKINNKIIDHPTIFNCLMTNSTQYILHKSLGKLKGIKIHCIDLKNNKIYRYVQPSSEDEFRIYLNKELGYNKKWNDYNHTHRTHNFHFWIGENIKGKVVSALTLPLTLRAWNDSYIHIAICVGKKPSKKYLEECLKELAEICKILCIEYGFSLSQIEFYKMPYLNFSHSYWFKKHNLDIDNLYAQINLTN